MKKIAIVTNTSWNILNFRTSLVEELKKHYEVILIAPKDQYSSRIQQLGETHFLHHLSRKGTNPVTDLKLISELKKLYKELEIDLAIHFTIKPNIYGSIAAKQAGIKSIAVVTGLGYTFLSNGLAAKAAKKLYKYAFKRNSLTVFQNVDDQKLFQELGLVPQQTSTVVDGSGIDVNEFSPKPKNNYFNQFNFLFIGRMLYDKGVKELLDAFVQKFEGNSKIVLHLVGNVDNENPSVYSEDELKEITAKHKNILFHGRIDGPSQMIADCECVVLPSYREGLPRVMLESIAMAKPIITTDTAGCREVVKNENGFLVPIKDSNKLGEAMSKMVLLTNEERASLGQKGRELAVERFSTEVVNQEYLARINDLLKN